MDLDVKKITDDIAAESAAMSPDADSESYEEKNEGEGDHVREIFDALKSDNFAAFETHFNALLASR